MRVLLKDTAARMKAALIPSRPVLRGRKRKAAEGLFHPETQEECWAKRRTSDKPTWYACTKPPLDLAPGTAPAQATKPAPETAPAPATKSVPERAPTAATAAERGPSATVPERASGRAPTAATAGRPKGRAPSAATSGRPKGRPLRTGQPPKRRPWLTAEDIDLFC